MDIFLNCGKPRFDMGTHRLHIIPCKQFYGKIGKHSIRYSVSFKDKLQRLPACTIPRPLQDPTRCIIPVRHLQWQAQCIPHTPVRREFSGRYFLDCVAFKQFHIPLPFCFASCLVP